MIEVVAGLIWNDDKILICKRPGNKSQPLLWEFPGGKIEAGETIYEALKREIKEELDVTIETIDVLCENTHDYGNVVVHLTFINAFVKEGTLKALEHEEIRWISPNEFDEFEFCPADKAILSKIKLK